MSDYAKNTSELSTENNLVCSISSSKLQHVNEALSPLSAASVHNIDGTTSNEQPSLINLNNTVESLNGNKFCNQNYST